MNKLLHILDEFIEEKNASWNHDDWLLLIKKINSSGIVIPDIDLGNVLENEKSVYLAKKQGLNIISKSKLVNLCRNFIKQHGVLYSESEWNDFLVNISNIGYYNKIQLLYHINIEKEKYSQRQKPIIKDQKIEFEHNNISDLKSSSNEIKGDMDDNLKKISLLEYSLSKREGHIASLSHLIESLKKELFDLKEKVPDTLKVEKEKLLKIKAKIKQYEIKVGKYNKLIKKESELKKAEIEIRQGNESLDKLKEHYFSELRKLKKLLKELNDYKNKVVK